MKHLCAIAFDFDGTLIESNRIKDDTFATIFSKWPDHYEYMMDWHLARNTVDRENKFRYFVEKVQKQPGNEKLIKQLTLKFSKLTYSAIVNCRMVEGAQLFLDNFKGRIPMFLLSATPQDELMKIVRERGMHKYFKKVYGAPINKSEILKIILKAEKINPDKMLFIGDAHEDWLAAESLGVPFFGRQSDRSLKSITSPVFQDFDSINEQFEHYYDI